jgi:hypothetical protein
MGLRQPHIEGSSFLPLSTSRKLISCRVADAVHSARLVAGCIRAEVSRDGIIQIASEGFGSIF